MKSIIERNRIINEFSDFWKSVKFKKRKPSSIVPPKGWKETLFVNSGLINCIISARKERVILPFSTCQPCIKLSSGGLSIEDMMIHNDYFTFFEQLYCGASYEKISFTFFVKNIWKYLTLHIGLNPKKIYIGIHVLQKNMRENWIKAGAPEENIVFPDLNAYELNIPSIKVHGIYSSIYYNRKVDSCSCKKIGFDTNFLCECFLEIGDVGIVSINEMRLIDHGIGLERLFSVLKKINKISQLPEFLQLESIVQKEFKGINQLYLKTIIDHLRSAIMISSSGVIPGKKGREYVFRFLLRKVFLILFISNKLEKEKFVAICVNFFEIITKNYPYLLQKNKFILEVKKEINDFFIIIQKGESIIRKYLRKRGGGILSSHDFVFLRETHGISEKMAIVLYNKTN